MKNQNKLFAKAVNLLMETDKPKKRSRRIVSRKRIKAADYRPDPEYYNIEDLKIGQIINSRDKIEGYDFKGKEYYLKPYEVPKGIKLTYKGDAYLPSEYEIINIDAIKDRMDQGMMSLSFYLKYKNNKTNAYIKSKKQSSIKSKRIILKRSKKTTSQRKPRLKKSKRTAKRIKAYTEENITVKIKNLGDKIELNVSSYDDRMYIPNASDFSDVDEYFKNTLNVELEDYAVDFDKLPDDFEEGKEYTFDLHRYINNELIVYPELDDPNILLGLISSYHYDDIYLTDQMLIDLDLTPYGEDGGEEYEAEDQERAEYESDLQADFAEEIYVIDHPVVLKDEALKYSKEIGVTASVKKVRSKRTALIKRPLRRTASRKSLRKYLKTKPSKRTTFTPSRRSKYVKSGYSTK